MAFAADIRRWESVAAFEAHLALHSPHIADWAEGLCLHHTYTPTVAQWRGLASVQSTKDYYIHSVPNSDGSTGGWPSGPHLFICGDAPNPDHRGIFQLTPLNLPGTHAGRVCNATVWACEVVGRYDTAFWDDSTAALVYGATAALYRWRDLDPRTLTGHKYCLNNKSCPGNAVVARLPAIRSEVSRRLAAGQPTPEHPRLSEDSGIIHDPRTTPEQAARALLARAHGTYDRDDITQIIVPAYWRICQSVGVDPLVAIAQLIHETGNLTSALSQRTDKDGRNLRNPAGIGVYEASADATDYPRPGCVFDADAGRDGGYRPSCQFPTWVDDAIPAHVGRLLAYAIAPADRTDVQNTLVRRALTYRSLPSDFQGTAPRLKALGRAHNPMGHEGCGWASPGTEYGARIAEIANRIIGT